MSAISNQEVTAGKDPVRRAGIEGQVARIQASKLFLMAPVAGRLLGHIVGKALNGQEESLKETLIALDVYGNAEASGVREAAAGLRKRLSKYYVEEGREDPYLIEIPTGGYVPQFSVRSRPEPPAEQGTTAESRDVQSRTRPIVIWACVAATGVLVTWLILSRLGGEPRITSPAYGATVGSVEYVSGIGCRPGPNCYLVVEPLDHSGRRWVEGQIASHEWTLAAHFGQADTPPGMRYRVYVLSTSTVVPVGALTKQTDSPQESPAITVTLKK